MMKKRSVYLAALLLILAVFAIYSQTARFGLINCDDYEYLVRSTAILPGFSSSGMDWAWGSRSLEHAIWMPLTWMSYMLDFTLWGDAPWGVMHLHGVVLHALNAVLVFLLLRLLLKRIGGERPTVLSFAVAALWALHPLRVESVAWLASRKDVLSLAFELGAMIFWVKSLAHRSDSGRFCALYGLSLLFFGLGALAKPSVMTFPVLQLCVDVFVLRRIRPKMYIVPGILTVIIAIEAAYAQSVGGATGDLGQIPLFWRILNAMSAYGVYLVNTVCPTALAPQCMSRFPELPRGILLGSVLSLSAAGYAAVRLLRLWLARTSVFARQPEDPMGEWTMAGEASLVFAGLLWFSLGIGPMLGIANFGYHAYCDRFTYIPAIGLSLVVLGLVRRGGRFGVPLLALGAVALASLSVRQVGFWRSEKSLWTQTLAVDGERNAVARIGLGIAAFELEHDLETCCAELKRVREINEGPYWNCVQVHVYALCELGRLEEANEALDWFRRAHQAYSASHTRIEQTPMGPMEVPMRLTNFTDAEIAVAICDEKRRAWAEREIANRYDTSTMTPSLAYLMFRFAEVTKNDKLRETARKELAACEKTDFLQFRYLTQKEK